MNAGAQKLAVAGAIYVGLLSLGAPWWSGILLLMFLDDFL